MAEKPKGKMSGARCFPKDLPRIKRLSRILSLNENADVFQEHVITRALSALEEKVDRSSENKELSAA